MTQHDDAVFAADKQLIKDAADAPADPRITRAERLAESFAGAQRARAQRGGEG